MIVSKNEKSGLYIVSYPRTPASLPTTSGPKATNTDKVAVTWSTVQVGQIITGKVVRHSTLAALVQISGLRGRLHACDISDDFSAVSFPQPEGPLNIGDTVQCAVLKVDSKAKTLELSSRQSKVLPKDQGKGAAVRDAEIGEVGDLVVGKKVRGFVKNVAGGGVFVALGRGVTARVMIKELFDDVSNEKFEKNIGRDSSAHVHVRIQADTYSMSKTGNPSSPSVNSCLARSSSESITSFTSSPKLMMSRVDTKSNLVEMTFRTKPSSASTTKKTAQLSLSDFTENQTVVAVVKKVEEYGIFLRIEGSNVSGLCHKSEVSLSAGGR